MSLRRHITVNPEYEHFQRMEHWYARLLALPADAAEVTLVEYALVVLQQCDSMRDWLHGAREIKAERDRTDPARSYKSVETAPIPEADVKTLFARHELQLGRAIVDGAKHLTLDRHHIDNNAVSDVPMPNFFSGEPIELHPVFEVAGKQYEAVDLCKDCVMLIRGFFTAHGQPGPMMRTVPDLSRDFLTVPDHLGTPWP